MRLGSGGPVSAERTDLPTDGGPLDERDARLRAALDPDVFEQVTDAPEGEQAGPRSDQKPSPQGDALCERCGQVTAAENMVWDMGQRVCPACIHAGNTGRRLNPEILAYIGAAILILLVLAGGLAFALFHSYQNTPAYALDQIRSAIGNRDTAALGRYVDVNTLNAQIEEACRRYDPNPLETSTYATAAVMDGLTSARVDAESKTTATAYALARVGDTGSTVRVEYQMAALPATEGVQWVVTGISNANRVVVAFRP
jgi:hypothetical protein